MTSASATSHLKVADLQRALGFYCGVLGFELTQRFAITSPRSAFAGDTIHRRKPGALHHLAFRAASRAEVDRLHSDLKEIGATIVSPPREYPEYNPPGYYALFFKDLEGIKYEIVCHEHSGA